MRRTVATLLVVASPLLMAAPVGAQQGRAVGPAVIPAAPEVVQAPVPVTAVPVPVTVAPPAVPAPTAVAVTPPAAPTSVRHTVKTLRGKAPAAADLSDAAYAARLQADLCQARQIFCGLDRGGRYLAG